MAISPIPKELYKFIVDWVSQNEYNLAKLRAAVNDHCTKQSIEYSGDLTDTKLQVALAKGFVQRERTRDPEITVTALNAKLRDLGLHVTGTTVRHYVEELLNNGEIPQSPAVLEERRQSMIKESLESLVSNSLRTRTQMRKSLPPFLRYIQKRLRKQMDDDSLTVSEDQVRTALEAVFWTKERMKAMENFRREGLPFEMYLNLPNSGIESAPEWVLHEKWKDMKGRTERPTSDVQASRGVWNISSAFMYKGKYTIPESSPEQYLVIPEGHNRSTHVMATLTAPHFGSLYDPSIVNNLLRMAAADLEKRKVDSLIIAGQLFYISTDAAAGKTKVRRDLYSGLTLDTDAFAELYQKRVDEIMDGLHEGELVYMTADERLEHLLTGMWEVWQKPNHKPEFTGKVYVVLGPAEEEIADAIATARQRYETKKLIPRIDAELKSTTIMLVGLENTADEIREEGGVVDEKLLEKIAKCKVHIKAIVDRKSRTAQALVHPIHARKDIPVILAWMAKKIEDAIPNSTVVGIGSTYLKWQNVGSTVLVYQSDKNKRAFDAFMKGHGSFDRTYGLPDVVITVNSHAKYATTIGVESVHGDGRKTVLVCEPPIMIDKKAILQVRGTKTVNEPAIRAVYAPEFTAGFQVFEFHKPEHETQPRFPPTFYTVTDEHIRYAAERADRSAYTPAHVSMLGATDPHFSSMNSMVSHTPRGELFNVLEAFLEMTLRAMNGNGRAPFHYMDVCDDWGQYLNFAVYTNLHPDRESLNQIYSALGEYQSQLGELLRQPSVPTEEIENLTNEIRSWVSFQLFVRGEHTVSEQLDMIRDALERYRLVVAGILRSALHAGISVKSRTEIVGRNKRRIRKGEDRRRLGIINNGASNHFSNTFDRNRPGLLFDSEVHRNMMVAAFTSDQSLAPHNTPDALRNLITAPRSGASSVGLGVLYHKDTMVCPIEMRPSPIRRGPWHDTLRPSVGVDNQRADPAGLFVGNRKYRMFRTGDKHMFQVIVTGTSMYIMGAPGTLPDDFADVAGGIRPNGNGVTLTFVPATGITTGPTRIMLVPGYVLAHYVAHPEERFPLFDMMPKLLQ